MVDIVVIGHILNEKIVFPDRVIYPLLGSPVAYSSCCMSSMGASVGIVTSIGIDFPTALLEVFYDLKVNLDGLTYRKNSTNNEMIYDENGNKTLKFLSKADNIVFDDIPESFHNAEIFYICPMDYEVSAASIKDISELKNTVIVDLGGYGGASSDTHPALKDGSELKEFCPHLDIVKASIEDCYHIFGDNIKGEKKISEKLIDMGVKTSIITLGKDGAYVRTADLERYIPPYPSENIVDRTGAGDCFSAGFIANYLNTKDLIEAAFYGTAATSYIIERTGGVITSRMPNLKEVEKRVAVLKKLPKITGILKKGSYR